MCIIFATFVAFGEKLCVFFEWVFRLRCASNSIWCEWAFYLRLFKPYIKVVIQSVDTIKQRRHKWISRIPCSLTVNRLTLCHFRRKKKKNTEEGKAKKEKKKRFANTKNMSNWTYLTFTHDTKAHTFTRSFLSTWQQFTAGPISVRTTTK